MVTSPGVTRIRHDWGDRRLTGSARGEADSRRRRPVGGAGAPHRARRAGLRRRAGPAGRVDRRHVRRVLDRVGLIQIDSVNVLVRSQELPLFARLGPHPRDLLPRMAADGELFEYWCHEASLLPIAIWPLLRWRMRSAGRGWNGRRTRSAGEAPGLRARRCSGEVREHGPLTAGELPAPGATVVVDVGLEPGQARARVPVLERRGHRPPAAVRLRARLRPDRARDPGRRAGPARPGRGRGASASCC